MNLTSQAKYALASGNYELAHQLYQRAMKDQPELAHIYLISLNIARSKMGMEPHSRETLHRLPNTPTQNYSNDANISKTTYSNLDHLYRMVTFSAPVRCQLVSEDRSLVSILITAKNSAKFIEESVTSALRQTWKNLEVIVIDNASTDATWTILKRLQASVNNLICRKINVSSNDYFAKNYALKLARGEFIFFQNGSDLCHPERIDICMHYFEALHLSALRGTYSTISPPSNTIIPDNSRAGSLDLATTGFRRNVFEAIGNFDCATHEPGLDLLNRMRSNAEAKNLRLSDLELPLYYSPLNIEGANTNFQDENPAPSQSSQCISAPPLSWNDIEPHLAPRENYAHSSERTNCSYRHTQLATDSIPLVVATLCSIPERAELLRQVLASLAPQVDALHIYLDRYDSIPDFVRNCHSQVTVYLSKDHPGLRDNGKFLAFSALEEDCYYFTADDDIVYPPDYVASMVRRIEDYERQAVIGVHGVLLPEQADAYFTSFRKVHMFKKELERDALVNNLGTGTVAFHSSLLRGLDLTHFGTPGMADLYLSVFCKQRDIPMIALARPEDWLQELPSPNTSLYNEFRQADDQQSALIRAHKPWGYAAITKAVAGASMRATKPDTGERLQRLIPLLHACLK